MNAREIINDELIREICIRENIAYIPTIKLYVDQFRNYYIDIPNHDIIVVNDHFRQLL